MITCICKDESLLYQSYHLLKAFFPEEEIERRALTADEKQSLQAGEKETPDIYVRLSDGREIWIDSRDRSSASGISRTEYDKKAGIARLYKELEQHTGRSLAWGMLTGVRPVKLAMDILAGEGVDAASSMKEKYFVSDEKAKLAHTVAKKEREMLTRLVPDGVSLYVGIPFCPSICSYCSFGSARAGEWAEQMDDYVEALVREIASMEKYAAGRRLQTVYIGGGTPTTLTVSQMSRLFDALQNCFSMDDLLEFTVEAGRPDSIDMQKLELLRKYPVTRISVNPQTMNDETLLRVGRNHTADDVKRVFHMARSLGFDNINMDLIAGLPGETKEHMRHTVSEIEKLRPDSLTVHALAIKRAARYGQEKMAADLSVNIEEMLSTVTEFCGRMGYEPYYLYRQKNIAGNFENTGYAFPGRECLYNILIMEERQTILAAGAKAGTKIVLPEKIKTENGKLTNLLRHENVKDIRSYIDRVDEMIEKKGELLWG